MKLDLHQDKKISTNFKEEIKFIKDKFIKTDFPLSFINSVIKDLNNQQEIVQQNNEEELIIPLFLSQVQPLFLLLKLLYCEKNEVNQKT